MLLKRWTQGWRSAYDNTLQTLQPYSPLTLWGGGAVLAVICLPQCWTVACWTLPLLLLVLQRLESLAPYRPPVGRWHFQLADDRLLLVEEKTLLELLARGRPLPELMESLCRMVEQGVQGVRCSVMLLDESRTRLHVTAGPSLPAVYSAAVDGLVIGPGVGSCGSAAWHNEVVIVEDVLNHPFWEGFRALILPYPMRACWSVPIRGAQGEVLGTFALYYDEVRGPGEADMAMVHRCGEFASLAILHHQALALLQRHADHDPLTGLYHRQRLLADLEQALQAERGVLSLLLLDLDGFQRINHEYGLAAGDEVLRQLARLCRRELGETCCIGRVGDDEFAAILPGVDASGAWQVADRLCREVENLLVVHGAQRMPAIRASIAVVARMHGKDGAQSLLASAGRALAANKVSGEHTVMREMEFAGRRG